MNGGMEKGRVGRLHPGGEEGKKPCLNDRLAK